jgi:hypothetical protein
MWAMTLLNMDRSTQQSVGNENAYMCVSAIVRILFLRSLTK